MDLTELHKKFTEANIDGKKKILSDILLVSTAEEYKIKVPEKLKNIINVGAGLFIRAPKSFQQLFLGWCGPKERRLIIDAMKLTPQQMGLTYDKAGDPKKIEALKKRDLDTIAYYNEIRLKKEKDEKDHAEWTKKHEAEVVHAKKETSYTKQETMWKRLLHEEIHDVVMNPLPLLIADLVLHGKFDDAAKKFLGADIKVQRHLIHDICDSKHKKDVEAFIAALERSIAAEIEAAQKGGKLTEGNLDMPEFCHRAKVCIQFMQELIAPIKK